MILMRWLRAIGLAAPIVLGLHPVHAQEDGPAGATGSVVPALSAPVCADLCQPCGPCGQFWIGADLLGWSAKGDRLPPLITTSPAGTPRNQAGVLGSAATTTLFGGDRVNDDLRLGYRIFGGLWLDDCRTLGLEGEIFFLDPLGDGAALSSTGNPILGRPFVNAATGAPDAELVAFPGVLAGSVAASADSTVWGAGINGRANLCCGCNYRLDALAGYRFLGLSDTLTITEDLQVTDPAFVPGTRFQIEDRFRTTNAFHGGLLGLRGEHWLGRFIVQWNASVALGGVHQTIQVDGSTQASAPGQPASTLPGGLLALPSNSGDVTRNAFAVLPAAGLAAGYQVTNWCRILAGYDFLFLSQAARPGDVIDVTINPALLPPPQPNAQPARPLVRDEDSTYWLQGITGRLELRF